MQPYFFPYIGYWQMIHAADRFVIYDDVNFIKNGWINRNRILINGEPCYITAPLFQASPFKKICDTSMQPSTFWRKKLIKMLETTYRRAPFFDSVFPVISNLINHETDNLADYIANQLQTLSKVMGIQTEFVVSSRSYRNNDLSGRDRVLDICKKEEASTYINAIGGMDLYSKEHFSNNEVDLFFIKPKSLDYKQFNAAFVPWLSIIDILMFNSLNTVQQMLCEYDLV